MTIAIAVKLGEYRGIITDTASVCETKDAEQIRTGETEDKVFLKDDSAIFCSGNMGVCNHIRRYILEMKDFSIEKVIDYLKYLNSIDPISNDDIAIIIVDKNKNTGIKANNNFEPIYFEGEGKIVSTGMFMVNGKRISSEEENLLINNKMVNYIVDTKNMTKALVKTAKDFINTEVGGKLKVFTYDDKLKKFELSYSEIVDNLLEESRGRAKQISHNYFYKLANHKVWEEKEDIEYSTFNGTVNASTINSSTLNGDYIIGSSINIGNGKFTVDIGGNASMQGTLNIAGGKIRADLEGNLYVEGIINASDIQINGTSILTRNNLIDSSFISGGISGSAIFKSMIVDQLSTSDKIINYLNNNTSEVNYIFVRDQYIEFYTENMVNGSEQVYSNADGTGLPIYWVSEDLANNIPAHTYITTEITFQPVMQYTYANKYKKMQVAFENNGTEYVPKIILGVGDGVTEKSAKAEIYKSTNGLELNYYKSNTGLKRSICVDDDGIHNKVEEYKPNAIVRNIIITTDEPNVSMGNVNDIIFKLKA